MHFRIVSDPKDDLGYIGDFARDGNRVWAVGGTHAKPTVLVREGDGAFTKMPSPPINGIRKMIVLGDRLLVCGEAGGVYASDDGARTWTVRDVQSKVCLFAFCDDGKGVWLAGEHGFVRRTKDRGETWKPMSIGTSVRVNTIEKLGAATYFACHDGTIVRYKRERIERLAFDNGAPLCAMTQTPRGTLIVCGDRGTIARSEDGSKWEKIAWGGTLDLEAIATSGDEIVIVGDAATVLVSTDDGKTFERVPCDLPGHLWSVLDTPSGLLVGGDRGLVAEISPGI
jgi:photosystem II stability/assembly factor-like uncharacterized protein